MCSATRAAGTAAATSTPAGPASGSSIWTETVSSSSSAPTRASTTSSPPGAESYLPVRIYRYRDGKLAAVTREFPNRLRESEREAWAVANRIVRAGGNPADRIRCLGGRQVPARRGLGGLAEAAGTGRRRNAEAKARDRRRVVPRRAAAHAGPVRLPRAGALSDRPRAGGRPPSNPLQPLDRGRHPPDDDHRRADRARHSRPGIPGDGPTPRSARSSATPRSTCSGGTGSASTTSACTESGVTWTRAGSTS